MRKMLALISSGCERSAVSKHFWQSQFLDRFQEFTDAQAALRLKKNEMLERVDGNSAKEL
jgi:hypothetical protein